MPFGPIERVAPARSVAAANASALTPPYACMLRQAVQDAIVHLDHNSGTKNRLWVSTRWIAEVLCPGGLCAKDQRRALRGLQTGAIKGDKRLDQNERNAMLQTTLRGACRAFRDRLQPPPQLTAFDATRRAKQLLRMPAPDGAALDGLPLHLANCTDDARLAPWQTWRLGSSMDSTQHLCRGMCVSHHFRLQAAPDVCLSLGRARSPRQPYTTLAQLGLCSRAQPPSAQQQRRQPHAPPTAEIIRTKLNFLAVSGLLRTSHALRDIKRHVPEQRIGCGFWSMCSGTRTALPKPCWLHLRANASACGENEPTVLNMLARAKLPKKPYTQGGYDNITLGPGGPQPWPVLANPGSDRLCLRSWRGSFKEGNAVGFHQCPQTRASKKLAPTHKWSSLDIYRWEARDVEGGSMQRGERGKGGGERTVRLVPRETPHMCLTAPPLLASRGLAIRGLARGGRSQQPSTPRTARRAARRQAQREDQ